MISRHESQKLLVNCAVFQRLRNLWSSTALWIFHCAKWRRKSCTLFSSLGSKIINLGTLGLRSHVLIFMLFFKGVSAHSSLCITANPIFARIIFLRPKNWKKPDQKGANFDKTLTNVDQKETFRGQKLFWMDQNVLGRNQNVQKWIVKD